MRNVLLLVPVLLVLAGCADHVSFTEAASREPVGFLHGLWHGAILPFSFVISLFDGGTAIYAIYNTGGWYDFGYLLGASGIVGGGVAASR
ncbi:hypothetical protein [Paludibacterium paludis]|uniref:Lipoprotein n=1 Tax=Paludibacterium paludis TaxID=1225769 RepID=A0A918UB67_9NEIS|nr:hypothetical protein [Paludibacterium paludis]GGY20323.1 hypothetical protein GCM10011289_24870 [Paludibacterium paludis]